MNNNGGNGFIGAASSNSNSNFNFDDLLLQSLISRLHLRPPITSAAADKSLEDLIFSDFLLKLHDSDSDDSSDTNADSSSSSSKTPLAREEAKLEKQIIRTIHSGEIEKLKPNSGQAISIGEHRICVGFQEESRSSDYRVWEWHGHIMLFDEENGYTPEYIYGNYFEKIGKKKSPKKTKEKKLEINDDVEKELDLGKLGLKELIENVESSSGRILHRNIGTNPGSPKFI